MFLKFNLNSLAQRKGNFTAQLQNYKKREEIKFRFFREITKNY